MAVTTSTSVTQRQELGYAIMEGASLNRSLIWDKVLPPLPLNKRTAHLPKLSIAGASLMRIINDLTAPGANVPRMNSTVADFTLNVAIRKQEIGIPVEAELDYADLFSLEMFWSKQLGQNMLSLTIEYLANAQLFSTTNFGAATNSTVAYTVANQATNSLISDIYAAIERVRDQGEQPNTIVLSSQVFQRVSQSAAVTNFVIGQLGVPATGFAMNTDALQRAFASEGIEQVLIGRSQYNSAAEGSKTLSRVWSNAYIWVGRSGYKNEMTDLGVPVIDGVGGTAFWQPYGLMTGETYYDAPREQQVVRGKTSANPTILNANAGTLIGTQYA